MGYSYGNSNTPVMCFNSAKSWQFGWYDQRHLTVDANSNRAYKGKLISILNDPNISSGDPMLIKIETGTNADYFINFNRRTGFNSGTVEGGDQVLITVAGNGNNYAESNLQAKLSAGQTWSATVGTETVSVKVNLINTSSNGFADVDICFGQCPNVDTPGPTAVPTTSPTKRPTPVPTTKAPTTSPTKRPTAVPTSSPTKRPTAVPTTKKPTTSPTKRPTAVPTTKNPTASPTKRPTISPVISPTPFVCSTITRAKICKRNIQCSWIKKSCVNK